MDPADDDDAYIGEVWCDVIISLGQGFQTAEECCSH